MVPKGIYAGMIGLHPQLLIWSGEQPQPLGDPVLFS